MFGDLGDGLLDDVVRVVFQFAKYQWVGEGLGETLEVDHRAIDPQGCSSFVFIVKDGLREELLEACDVLVSDVVVE